MIKANYCISIDNKKDYHISMPGKEPNLPNGLRVVRSNLSVPVSIADLGEVLTAHKEHNQERVNEILKGCC